MTRPPPISPLFPYTPLSRSRAADLHLHRRRRPRLDRPRRIERVRRRPPERASRLPRRARLPRAARGGGRARSEEHTSELQSRQYLVCRLLLEKKKTTYTSYV